MLPQEFLKYSVPQNAFLDIFSQNLSKTLAFFLSRVVSLRFLRHVGTPLHSVHASFLDVAKAFDRMDHSLLLHKLEKIGISGGSALSSGCKRYLYGIN